MCRSWHILQSFLAIDTTDFEIATDHNLNITDTINLGHSDIQVVEVDWQQVMYHVDPNEVAQANKIDCKSAHNIDY